MTREQRVTVVTSMIRMMAEAEPRTLGILEACGMQPDDVAAILSEYDIQAVGFDVSLATGLLIFGVQVYHNHKPEAGILGRMLHAQVVVREDGYVLCAWPVPKVADAAVV